MSKKSIFVRLISALCCLMTATNFVFAENGEIPDGDGSVGNLYKIATTENLYWFANYVNQGGENLNANAILVNDIVVNTEVLVDGELNTTKTFREWTPIGNGNNKFQGTFDGNGKTISGLYFDNSEQNYVGLFGYNDGTVENVGVIDSYFKGKGFVGGVCGKNYGAIKNCYNTGAVNGNDKSIGGVCGENYGIIKNCYNMGNVVGSGWYEGGVCGFHFVGAIENCYYLDSSSSQGIGGGVGDAISATIEQFANGTVAQWLLNGTNGSVWGQYVGVDESPTLLGKYAPVQITGQNREEYNLREDYIGYYAISNVDELYWFSGLVNGKLVGVNVGKNTSANAVLTSDIVVNKNVLDKDGKLNAGEFRDWEPMGNATIFYAGTFDGLGHTISGLVVNDSDKGVVGLFGRIGANATVKNIGVVDSYFCGKNNVGAVCGLNQYGTIKNNYNMGIVISSGDYVGGVCGYNDQGAIENCHNTGSVKGSDNVGGMCGYNNNGTITNCYNAATVIVSGYRVYGGGLCARNGGTIKNCYNIGTVKAASDDVCVGGLCGWNLDGAIIANCYNVGIVGGSSHIGGACGYTRDGIITNCYFLSGTDEYATQKTDEDFANGTVAKLLFAADSIWGQNTSKDTIPNFSGKIIFTVSVSASENGIVSGENGEYEYNTKLAIEAIPNEGYHFVKWSNGISEIKDTILVVSDTALVATFEAHTFGEPTFAWTEFSAATATFVCEKEDSTKIVDGVITADTTIAPTTEAEGLLVYTATFTFNGETYTDTQEEILDKLPYTAVDDVEANQVKVWGYNRVVYIENAEGLAQVFDATGRLVKSAEIYDAHSEIVLDHSGAYVVVVEGKAYKIFN